MSSINSQIYEVLRTYQRELNVREVPDRKASQKDADSPFSKILEKVAAPESTETARAVEGSGEPPQPGGQEQSSEMLKNLNYDPTGYLVGNSKGRQSIIDFFQ